MNDTETTQQNNGKNDIRCMVCRAEFNSKRLAEEKIMFCPNCETTMKPTKISWDGYFKLNWNDMRILAIYAQRWMERFDTKNRLNMEYIICVDNIIKILAMYRPKDAQDLDPTIQTEIRNDDDSMISPYFNENI